MAKPNSTQRNRAAANDAQFTPAEPAIQQLAPQHPDRHLKVMLVREYRPSKTSLRIAGQWLKKAGFLPDMKVRVRVMQGCLVITIRD